MRCTVGAWVLGCFCACGRSGASPDPIGADPPEAAPAVATAAATPSSVAARGAPPVWSGTYKSVPAALYIPPELKVSWKPAETAAGVGEGALSLTIDPATGRVRGEVKGPLGPATVAGFADDGKLTAKIERTDPSDHGFAGTMVGTLGGDKGEGTMNLSLGEGGAIRSATFVLSKIGSDARASR